uniref:Uncharacterized protein n=1 Tax=Nothobranchius kadleci TaxID=1051664 RepID=A0A1A8BC82_NOTKA
MLAAGGSSSSALQFRGGAVALPVNPADVPALEIKLGALVVLLSITLVFGFAPLCIVRGTGRCSINSDNYTDLCQQREAFIKGEDIWKREEDRGGKRKIKPNSRWMDNEEESQQSKKQKF